MARRRGGRGRAGKPPKVRVPVPDGYVPSCRHHGTLTITGGDCFLNDRKHRHEECGIEEVHRELG